MRKYHNRFTYMMILLAVAVAAFFFMPEQQAKAAILQKSDIESRETRDNEAFTMIIGLAERCPYLGSVEGSFVYGGQTYVYIANNVHKTNKADVYYSTCALEFSRQKDANKYKDTSGDGTDYYRHRNNSDSFSSIVLCSPNFNEQAYTRTIYNYDETVKEAASFQTSDFNTRFLETKDDVKVASFVDAGMTKNGEKYVSTYFIIKEQTLNELIAGSRIDTWETDFNDIIDKNPDNEDYYWLKMNKIITTHSEKGYVSCVTNYNVQDENTTLAVKGNTAHTGSSLVANVRSALKDGALTNFDKLCEIANGGKFTQATRTGIEKSWHQSVPIKLKKRRAVYTFYDVSTGTPVTVWHVNVEEYDKTVTNSTKNPPSSSSAFTLKFNAGKDGGVIENNLSERYRFATPEEYGSYVPMKEHKQDINDIKKVYNEAKDDSLNATTRFFPAYDSSAISAQKYMTGVFDHSEYNIRSAYDNYTSGSKTISYTNGTNWWIPVYKMTQSMEVKAVYYDVDTGEVVDSLIYTKTADPSKEFLFTLSQKDFDQWSRSWTESYLTWTDAKRGSFKLKYMLAMDKSSYGKRAPVIAWSTSSEIGLKISYDAAVSGTYKRSQLTFTNSQSTWQASVRADTFKDAEGRAVVYVPVKAVDSVIVRYYDVNNPSHMLDIIDVHKVNDSGAITYTPVNNAALTVSKTKDDDYLQDTDGSQWKIVFRKEKWGDNQPIAVWNADKNYEKYNSALKETGIVRLKNTEGSRRFWCNSNTVPTNGYHVTIFVPVAQSICDMDIHYVDIATGKLVGDTKKASYDQETGNARHMQNNCSHLHIDGTADDVFYQVCTEMSEWGSYAPIFAYGSSSYASVRYSEAASDRHVDAVVKDESKNIYSFSHNNGYLTGYVGLYIPVKRVAQDLVVSYVDVATGETVRTASGTVEKDGSAAYVSVRKFDAKGKAYEVAVKSAEYGSYKPMFFWSTDAGIGSDSYAVCESAAAGKAKPSVEKKTAQITYSCGENTLKDHAVLFIPVIARSEISVELYYIDVKNGKDPVLKGTETKEYDPGADFTYSADAMLENGYVLSRKHASKAPTTAWESNAGVWSSLCGQYYPVVVLYDGTRFEPAEKGSLDLTVAKGKLSGKAVLKIYYAFYDNEVTPTLTPDPGYSVTGGTIMKNPKTGDADGDVPNTAFLNLGTGDDNTAPDVFTYNYSSEFDIGKGIPTTESITNGIEVDTWYGTVNVKSMEVHPSAQVKITARAKYKKYSLTYSDIYGECTDYSHYTEKPRYVGGILQKDKDGNIIYDRIYDTYRGVVETVPTGYTWSWEYVDGSATRIFDCHDSEKAYGFCYINSINLYQLENVTVSNKALGDSTVIRYSSSYNIPYQIKINPVTGNGLNLCDSVTTGGSVNTPLSDVTSLMKTHISIGGGMLDFDNLFGGVPYEYTMSDLDGYDLTVNNSSYNSYYSTVIDAKGNVVWSGTRYYLDGVSESGARTQAQAKASTAADSYYTAQIQNNASISIGTKSDTLKIKGVTYCSESNGLVKKGNIPDDTDTSAPDKLTTYGKGTPKNPRVDKNTAEQVIPIPVDIENNYYGTRISATYRRIAYTGGSHSNSVTITVDDGERGDKNYEEAILVLDPSAVNDVDDRMSVFRNNEPVLVHSPVIAPIEIKKDSTGATQSIKEVPYAAQLLLDKTYTVDFVWDPVYGEGSDYYFKKGYYEDKDEGYTKYVKSKFVRFPFPVMTCAGKDTSDTEMTYYPLKTTEISKDGSQIVRFTDWIELKETAWERFDIYIPTWAQTGYYDETSGADRSIPDRFDASIQVEVYANNSTETRNKREYKWNRNADVQKLIEMGVIDVTDITTYAATFSYPVQISGWVYGFELVATNDQTTYGDADEDMMDNRYSFVTNRTDMKVGGRNRIGEQDVRYTYGEDVTTGWPWTYTLPITTGKSTLYKTRGTMRLGTEFSFLMKSILGENPDLEDTYVEITPSFRYITEDGSVYDSDQIEVYYDYINDKYLQYGSDKDTEITADLETAIKSDWFYDAQRFMPDSTQYCYSDRRTVGGKKLNRNFGQYLNTWLLTSYRLGLDVNDIAKRKTQLGTLSTLRLDSTVMLVSGSETELEANLATDGTAVSRISATESYESEFRSSMQTWYGRYRIPHDLYVLRKDRGYDTLKDYFEENAWLENWQDVFETDGYLVLNFDITVYENRNGELVPTLSYHKAALDMWARENDGLTTYTAYQGYWGEKDVDYTIDDEGIWHNKNEVTIKAESGDVAVITRTELGAEGGDEKQPGMLWINQ